MIFKPNNNNYLFLSVAISFCVIAFDFLVIGAGFGPVGHRGSFFVGGSFTGKSFAQYYMKDYFLIGDLISFLYDHFSGVPWFGVSMLFINFLSLVAILYAMLIYSRRYQVHPFIIVLFTTCVIALTNLNLIINETNRTVFLAAFGSLSLLFVVQSSYEKVFISVLFYLLLINALFTRFEALVGALMLFSPIFIYGFLRKEFKANLHFFLVLIFVLLYSILFTYKLYNDQSFYYQIEPDFEYELMDRNNIIPISDMKTKGDSIRYEAIARHWMLSDSTNIPASFIRSLIKKEPTLLSKFTFKLTSLNANFIYRKTSQILLNSNYYTLFVVMLFSIYLIRKDFNALMAWISVVLLHFFLLVIAIGNINAELDIRFSDPILASTAICISFITFSSYRINKNPLHINNKLLAFMLMIVLLFVSLNKSRNVCIDNNYKIQQTEQFVSAINNLKGVNYIIVFSDEDLYYSRMFDTSIKFPQKKVIPIDFVQYSYAEKIKMRLRELTGCLDYDFKCRFDFIIRHKDETLFIGNEKRIRFFEKYLKEIYNVEISFEEIQTNNYKVTDKILRIR
jgi:hypothetical protein